MPAFAPAWQSDVMRGSIWRAGEREADTTHLSRTKVEEGVGPSRERHSSAPALLAISPLLFHAVLLLHLS